MGELCAYLRRSGRIGEQRWVFCEKGVGEEEGVYEVTFARQKNEDTTAEGRRMQEKEEWRKKKKGEGKRNVEGE